MPVIGNSIDNFVYGGQIMVSTSWTQFSQKISKILQHSIANLALTKTIYLIRIAQELFKSSSKIFVGLLRADYISQHMQRASERSSGRCLKFSHFLAYLDIKHQLPITLTQLWPSFAANNQQKSREIVGTLHSTVGL